MHNYCDMRRFTDPYKDYDYDNDGYPGELIFGDDVYIDDYYMGELWKPIRGFEGEYMVSDMARVWSIKNQQFLRVKPLDNHGHLGVCLTSHGRRYYRYIHRLVADAFIPNPSNYPIVRHLDDQPDLNETNYIAWGTRIHNYYDALHNGKAYIPTEADREKGLEKLRTPIRAINKRTGEVFIFRGQGDAERAFGIPQSNIWKVLNGYRNQAGGYIFEYMCRGDET